MTQLTIHRSADSIGGNCIEVAADGYRLLLDMGRPLDAAKDAINLLPKTLDCSRPVDAILVSHPHQDHYGLLDEVPGNWPVYCGEPTGKLMQLTLGIFGKQLSNPLHHWQGGKPFTIGPFSITPYLTDHSAFDAYMLQIDVGGKRIFYSGDFRMHGRKGALVERLMANPPDPIDILLMEGTNLSSDKPCTSEQDLERDYIALFRKTAGRVFVSWSAQNVDRTVTLFRACKQAGRTLVVDLYTAEVMDLLTRYRRIPAPDWDGIKVVITRSLANHYRRLGRGDFVDRMVRNGIPASALAAKQDHWVVMVRPSLLRDFQKKGVSPHSGDCWSWGQWLGYLNEGDGARVQEWFSTGNTPACHLHTSGHASMDDLREFATRMRPKQLVPIHGVKWDEAEGFPNLLRLRDGESWSI